MRLNTDGRKSITVNGQKLKVNYFVTYLTDDSEGKHCLTTASDDDGGLTEDGRWLLLVEG